MLNSSLTPDNNASPNLGNDGMTLGSKPRKARNFGTKKNSYQQRHSPLAYQVRKSHSKGNLRMSPASTHKMIKSPSFDNAPHFGASPSRKSLKNNKNGVITMSHRANLDASIARNSNRGIVTMSERNGL